MSSLRGVDEEVGGGAGPRSADGTRVTVLAVVGDEQTRALLPRVLMNERLILVTDLVRGLAFAQSESPDVVFVDLTIGNGAGLAMVHHMKALSPETSVFAMATKSGLEAGAQAVALGGAGLLMMPLGGDEVLNAVSLVKGRRAEKAVRAELMQQILMSARAAGWVGRMAELAEARNRGEAARRLAEVLTEATGATGAVVYLASADRPDELTRSAATAGLNDAPGFGSEADVLEFARSAGLINVPLALRSIMAGHVLLLNPEDAGMRAPGPPPSSADSVPASSVRRSALRDGLLKLLAMQASAALTLLYERERIQGSSGIKDPTTSAYSLASYADAAAREIYRASRYGRRFATVTVLIDQQRASSGAPEQRHAIAAHVTDHLLKVSPELSMIGRVDDDELHVLLPETDGIGAHAYRRRLLLQLGAGSTNTPGQVDLRGVLIGVATFPHDGDDLSQLTRKARRRAVASAASPLHQLTSMNGSLDDILGALESAAAASAGSIDPFAPRPIELPIDEAAALSSAAVAAALRGGPVLVVVTYRPSPNLFRAVRSSMGAGGSGITLRVLDVRGAPGGSDVEALCVFAEHGVYALLGRRHGNVLRGAHTADPLLTDALAVQLGRASGGRLFG